MRLNHSVAHIQTNKFEHTHAQARTRKYIVHTHSKTHTDQGIVSITTFFQNPSPSNLSNCNEPTDPRNPNNPKLPYIPKTPTNFNFTTLISQISLIIQVT